MHNSHRYACPSFIAIGPPRTATSWMHRVLEGHLALPRASKETDFFSTRYSSGMGWYLAHFRGYPAEMVAGEINPTYFDFGETPARINHELPGCKIICSLRDPAERAHSYYRLLQTIGWLGRRTFEQALELHSGKKFGPGYRLDYTQFRPGNIFGTGCYASHLKRWLGMFGPDRVMTVLYEDMLADPQRFMDSITGFIGSRQICLAQSAVAGTRINVRDRAALHPHLAARARRLREWLEQRQMRRTLTALHSFFQFCYGRGEVFPKIKPETSQALRELFRPEIEELEPLIGRDLSAWKN
jgi:Sulfotransferase domain